MKQKYKKLQKQVSEMSACKKWQHRKTTIKKSKKQACKQEIPEINAPQISSAPITPILNITMQQSHKQCINRYDLMIRALRSYAEFAKCRSFD